MALVTRLNPTTLGPPPGDRHAHIVIAPAGGRLAFIAGQVPLDARNDLVGGRDFRAQTVQCFRNVAHCLAALDAGPDQIVEMTVLVRGYEQEMFGDILSAGDEVFGPAWPVTAATLIGVEALGGAEFLVEIKAVVAV